MSESGKYLELLSMNGSKSLSSQRWQLVTGAQYLSTPSQSSTFDADSTFDTQSTAKTGKIFDKQVKTFCHLFKAGTRLKYPSSTLSSTLTTSYTLNHGFMVFQVFIPLGNNFSIELSILDKAGTHRRLLASSLIRQHKVTPLQASIPLSLSQCYDKWSIIILDLNSLCLASFKVCFGSVSHICFGGPLSRVRKVFMARDKPQNGVSSGGSGGLHKSNMVLFNKSLDYPASLHDNVHFMIVHLDDEIKKRGIDKLVNDITATPLLPVVAEDDEDVRSEDTQLNHGRITKHGLILTKPRSVMLNTKPLIPKISQTSTQMNTPKPMKISVPRLSKKQPSIKKPSSSSTQLPSKKEMSKLENYTIENLIPEDDNKDDDNDDTVLVLPSVSLENEREQEEIQQMISGSEELISSASKLLAELHLEAESILE